MARVLVVDDHSGSRTGLGELLADEGYEVDMAVGLTEALALVVVHPPDLVISDVRMAHTDGFAVAAALHALAKTHDVPVILVSALDDAPRRARAAAVGVSDYLTKPVDPEALLGLVRAKLMEFPRHGL